MAGLNILSLNKYRRRLATNQLEELIEALPDEYWDVESLFNNPNVTMESWRCIRR
jgi:hypothetical protein